MDQDIFWNSSLLGADGQNIPSFLLSSDDEATPYVTLSPQGSDDLSIWTSDIPSSTEHQGNHDENKGSTSRTANAAGGVRITESRFESSNLLSLQNVNINFNVGEGNDGQPWSTSQTANSTGGVRISEGRFEPANLLSLENVNINFNINEFNDEQPFDEDIDLVSFRTTYNASSVDLPSSSNISGVMSEGRDGLRLGSKRKITEGVPGPSTANGSTSFSRPNETNSTRSGHSAGIQIPGASSSEQVRGNTPDSFPPASVVENSDNSQRNFRPRIGPAHQHDIFSSHIFSSRNADRRSSIWAPNETLFQPPVTQGIEPRQPTGSSTSAVQPQQIHSIPWDADLMYVSEQPPFTPATLTRHLVQDSSNRSTTTQRAGLVGNLAPSGAGSSVGVHTLEENTWRSQQITPQASRSLAAVVQRMLDPSVGSESDSQNSNTTLERHANTQEVVHQSGYSSRRERLAAMRASLMMDRQIDNVPLATRSLTGREGRSRMLSEIRNALDLMRRGENLRSEDLAMLDHSIFHRAIYSQDRHRDMRLDVDNMSYEELLALEERIGNVSTGLSEEKISKCLKQRKHSSTAATTSAEPTEPCCICQEEYTEGEDLGALDCSHDFHAACIKQWLTHKNLCPICKTTALADK